MEQLESQAGSKKTSSENPKKQPKEKVEKIPDALLFKEVARAMEKHLGCRLPEFPEIFLSVQDPGNKRMFLRQLDSKYKIVESVSVEDIQDAIFNYVNEGSMLQHPAYRFPPKKCLEVFLAWRALNKPIKYVAPFSLLGEDQVHSFHQLSFSLDLDGPTPMWDELMSRCTNPEAIILYTGSIFDIESDRQQYPWIYGQGGNGKGSYIRLLEWSLGPAYVSEQATAAMKSAFWTASLMNVRLCAFNECNNSRFLKSDLFKMITGNDKLRVEGKFKNTVYKKLPLKVIFTSNDEPDLARITANLRRIIPATFKNAPGPIDPNYEFELLKEAPFIMSKCFRAYRAALGERGKMFIESRQAALDIITDHQDDYLLSIFNSAFVQASALESLPGAVICKELSNLGMRSPHDQKKFRNFIQNRMNVRKRVIDGYSIYEGIRLKTMQERVIDPTYVSDKTPAEEIAQQKWFDEHRQKNLKEKLVQITGPDGTFLAKDLL